MKEMYQKSSTKMNCLILKKIFHLVSAGFSEDIENLISSIPQDFKNREFEEKIFYYRLSSFDVPYICNNVSKMLTTQENLIFYRKSSCRM